MVQAKELEFAKLAQAKELELAKLRAGRGVWETVFGVSREQAQLLNLLSGGAVVLASTAYMVSGMFHSFQTTKDRADDARLDVRSLMASVQRALLLPLLYLRTDRPSSAARGQVVAASHRKPAKNGDVD